MNDARDFVISLTICLVFLLLAMCHPKKTDREGDYD